MTNCHEVSFFVSGKQSEIDRKLCILRHIRNNMESLDHPISYLDALTPFQLIIKKIGNKSLDQGCRVGTIIDRSSSQIFVRNFRPILNQSTCEPKVLKTQAFWTKHSIAI